jgi:GTP cyclohydrolase I
MNGDDRDLNNSPWDAKFPDITREDDERALQAHLERQRALSTENQPTETLDHRTRIISLVGAILNELGHDLSTDLEMRDTPRRIADFYLEFHQEQDLYALLGPEFVTPKGSAGGMVVQTNIPFSALCSHHFAPFVGTVAIGYLPGERIVGLSKLARVSRAAGKLSPSTQEHITNLIADTLHHGLKTNGVIVVTKAIHTCMCARGVGVPDVPTTVSAARGQFLLNPSARDEFFNIVLMER